MNIHKYNIILEEHLFEEPAWMPSSISALLIQLLLLEEFPRTTFNKIDYTSINSYMYKKVKLYNNNLARVVLSSNDQHVFITPRMFPLYSLEWCYATYEFMNQYKYELGWLYTKMYYKLNRVMMKRYNVEIVNRMYEINNNMEEYKLYNWNKILYTMLLDIVEYNFTNEQIREKINSTYVTEVIFSASRIPWSINDKALFTIPTEYNKIKDKHTKTSILLLHMLDNIATKTNNAKF